MLFNNFVSRLRVTLLLLKLGPEMKGGRKTRDSKDGVDKIYFNEFRVSHLVAISGSHSIDCVEGYLEKNL